MASNGFKVSNIDIGRAKDVFRGVVAQGAAGSGQVIVSDGTTEVDAVQVVFAGATVTELADGIAQVGVPTNGLPQQTISIGGTAQTLDLSVYGTFDITLTANITLTFVNPPPSGTQGIWYLILRQGGTGSYTVTWPATVKWQAVDGKNNGSAPTLYTAVGAEDVIVITTLDGGTTYGGAPEKELIVQDEGTALTSFATTLNFVGSGVAATGTGPVKTITISGGALGAAGGDLSGSYPNPTVAKVNGVAVTGTPSAGQVLTATSGTAADWETPATSSGTTFTVIGQEERTSDGTTTAWTLDNDFEENSVSARNLTTGHVLSVTETLPNTATISAAGTAGDVIAFAYAATVI